MRLDELVRDAQSFADMPLKPSDASPSSASEREVARELQICNACRYCEGFCAVFPAMTRRLEFPHADIHYLANLCHNCGACLYACQYAPPHEFAVNLPKAMAEVRLETYTRYAWPAAMGVLYRRNALVVALALGFALAAFLVLSLVLNGTLRTPGSDGNFYAVFPHGTMVGIFAPVFVFACVALGMGVTRFWRDVSDQRPSGPALADATHKALALTYLDGGHGKGCNDVDDRFSLSRRRFHHFTFYGFMLCFAATCVATLYHYVLGRHAPYPWLSLPVILGTLGGIGLLVGPAGLLALNLRRDARQGDPEQRGMDAGFISLLFFGSITGLLLLVFRNSASMAVLLAIHLGFVAALFITLPYGKFAHAVFRCAALLKWAVERRQPTNLTLGSE